MTKLIYHLVKFLVRMVVGVLGMVFLSVIFVLALPIAGWNKSKWIFKTHP